MELDEYDYLEKAVEEANGQSAKKETSPDNGKVREKSEKGYRRRERSEDDDELISEERDSRKSSSKKSRSEENGRDRDRQREEDRGRYRDRSSRHRSRDHESEKDGRSSRDRRRDSRERREDDSEKDRRSSRDRHRDSRERKEDDSEKDRGSSRDRHRGSRERKEDDSEKDRRSSRDKERDRDSRERRDRDREKEKERERRETEREMERERSRRSRSRSRLEHERERDLLRERERPDSRRYRDKKESEPEADPERDQRTVFAYQMPLKATERDVYDFFSKAGKVRDVKLIMDRNSRRSKGVGYIEFVEAMSVPMAIAMSGHPFLGQPIMVKPSEAEKNLVQSTASATSSGVIGPYGASDRKLYVGNLHFNMNEIQLRQIFEAFGPVELVQLPTDPETGHCKGFGFIQFAQLEHAKAAVSLNGTLEIAGRTIKVSSVTDHVGVQDLGTKTADFDDDEGGGLALNAQSRAMLMQKLDRSGIVSSVVGPLGVPGSQQMKNLPLNPTTVLPPQVFSMVPEPIGTPSECLLLKNMFDPATETEPEFDLDIRDDVQEECSKYGRVKHIYVDKNSAGYVYLRFESVEAASRAQQAMHKRWFARKMISAIFLQPYEYDAKFKGAA